MKILPDDARLKYSGRIDWSDSRCPVFVFPCTFVEMEFTGNVLKLHIKNHSAYWDNYLGCILDGEQTAIRLPAEGEEIITVEVKESVDGRHRVMLFKRQDACHEIGFMGFEIGDGERILELGKELPRCIEVYGDSVSAGEVSEAVLYIGQEDPQHNGEYSNSWYSYAWMTARKLHARIHDIAQGGIALLDNTGWFCEPAALGMESIWDKIRYNPALGTGLEWDFSAYIPQVVIIALGQNDSHPEDYMGEEYDGERGVRWRAGYQAFLQKIRKQYPQAHIICITTLLEHDAAWDRAVADVVQGLRDKKITQYLFRRNGKGTPGHLRIAEAEEMAEELSVYIRGLEIEGW